jgi:hypothetical protein
MLAIVAAVLWIVFAVATTAMSATALPSWEWYAINALRRANHGC